MLVQVLSLPGNLSSWVSWVVLIFLGGVCDMEYAVKCLECWQCVQG